VTAQREPGAQGVEALHAAILNQARRQARELLHEAQLEVEAIQHQAEQEAEAIGQEILARARRETALEKQRRVAAARLEFHRKQLIRREEQIAAVFAEAGKRLEGLHHSPIYPEILRRLIIQAAAALGRGELIVSANREDAHLLNDDFLAGMARELEQGTTLVPGDRFLDADAGIVVERANGRVRYDNTFSGRLERSRDLLRAAAYRILTGDN
jgi:V/A-type H+-transporting ATPase subunit E